MDAGLDSHIIEKDEEWGRMTLNSKYDIKDRVKIIAIGMIGVIIAIEWRTNGESYEVVYWNDGQRYSIWMNDWELEKEVQ